MINIKIVGLLIGLVITILFCALLKEILTKLGVMNLFENIYNWHRELTPRIRDGLSIMFYVSIYILVIALLSI